MIRHVKVKFRRVLCTLGMKGDGAALGTILGDNFISTANDGKVQTKAEDIAELTSGDIKFQTSTTDDMKVFLYGDAAVVSGKWKTRFAQKGKNIDTVERYTNTYVRQNGQWRCVASQGSAITRSVT